MDLIFARSLADVIRAVIPKLAERLASAAPWNLLAGSASGSPFSTCLEPAFQRALTLPGR